MKLSPTFDYRGFRGKAEHINDMYYCEIDGIEEQITCSSPDYDKIQELFRDMVNEYVRRNPEITPTYSEIANYGYSVRDKQNSEWINGNVLAVSDQDAFDFCKEKFNIKEVSFINAPIISKSSCFANQITEKARKVIKEMK